MPLNKKESAQPVMDESAMSRLIEVLVAELSHIAGEIEKFPIAMGHDYTSEEIELLQSIDFSRQKLNDISAVLRSFSAVDNGLSVDWELMKSNIKLETVRAKIL